MKIVSSAAFSILAIAVSSYVHADSDDYIFNAAPACGDASNQQYADGDGTVSAERNAEKMVVRAAVGMNCAHVVNAHSVVFKSSSVSVSLFSYSPSGYEMACYCTNKFEVTLLRQINHGSKIEVLLDNKVVASVAAP